MLEKLKELWAKYKLVVIIAVPLLILGWFRDLIIDMLVSNSNKMVDKTKEQSDSLKTQETKVNAQADQVIADADKKSQDKPEVTEDWNKK